MQQSKQAELERKMTATALENSLKKRASIEELAEKNIIAPPGSVSGALQDKQAKLERKMTATALENSLKKRSSGA